MNFQALTPSDPLWRPVRDYAAGCSWRAGKSLARQMNDGALTEWERVIAALEGGRICGYCTVAKTDCIPGVPYTPYIGYLFVGVDCRGRRLSQQLIHYAMAYLKAAGFDRVHIVSDHENLYEKYGFQVIDRRMAPWGTEKNLYAAAVNAAGGRLLHRRIGPRPARGR